MEQKFDRGPLSCDKPASFFGAVSFGWNPETRVKHKLSVILRVIPIAYLFAVEVNLAAKQSNLLLKTSLYFPLFESALSFGTSRAFERPHFSFFAPYFPVCPSPICGPPPLQPQRGSLALTSNSQQHAAHRNRKGIGFLTPVDLWFLGIVNKLAILSYAALPKPGNDSKVQVLKLKALAVRKAAPCGHSDRSCILWRHCHLGRHRGSHQPAKFSISFPLTFSDA